MAVTDDPVAASELENVIAVFGGVVDRAVQDDAAGATRARASWTPRTGRGTDVYVVVY
jgi:hypothetical protein